MGMRRRRHRLEISPGEKDLSAVARVCRCVAEQRNQLLQVRVGKQVRSRANILVHGMAHGLLHIGAKFPFIARHQVIQPLIPGG